MSRLTLVKGPGAVKFGNVVLHDADGIQGWFRNMTVKLGDGIAVSFFDITERKHNEEKLGYQAFLLDVGTEQPGTGPVRLCRVPRSQDALARHLAVGGVDHE